MASTRCGQYTRDECLDICMDFRNLDYDSTVQEELEAPMPYIGLYIAAASLVCALAIAADTLIGLRRKKLWFPCKYFSLNAFSLTLLAVASKLLVDLTSLNLGVNDKLVRISSLVMMSAALSNFTTSLGSMANNDIALNIAALAVFVVTITGNIGISSFQMSSFLDLGHTLAEVVGSTVSMLLLLLILCFSGLMVPAAKRQIDLAYGEMHRKVSNSDKRVRWGKFSVDELRIAVRRYWVMAETGSPQFVIARSVTCVASGLMCLLSGLILLEAYVRLPLMYQDLTYTSSNYKWSIRVILAVQCVGVMLGTVVALFRWFISAQFKSSEIGRKSFRDELKVESYWTEKLVDWRERALPLQIRFQILRKLLHHVKRLLLNFCIGVQILIVVASKLVLLASAVCVKGILFCFHHISSTLKSCCHSSSGLDNTRGVGSMAETESDYSGYVLQLEGESKIPQTTLKNICNEVDKLIKRGRKNQPKSLVKLLSKSLNFDGVIEFDTNKVPRLEYPHQEPPNCWSLSVVTLTSVAVSLPNISNHKSNQLLSAVSKGLYFVKLVEKSLDKSGDLTVIRHAADVVWVGVELSKKWLQNASFRGGSYRETLQNLSDIAGKMVTDFTTETKDPLMHNPLNWPFKVIAARSMYRITQTILLAEKDDDDSKANEQLFERLSIMISDILAACLTNLVPVIISKCHNNAIEEREESVLQAAILLGESEEILEILQKRDLPSLDPEKAANIEEWRAFMKLHPLASASVLDSINYGTTNTYLVLNKTDIL